VYVSVLAVTGRADGGGPIDNKSVDLGKPAYKLGVAKIAVNWKPHTLKVQVTTDKPTYTPRQTVTAAFKSPCPMARFRAWDRVCLSGGG